MITVSEFKTYLNINAEDTSKDTFLQKCINESVKDIESYCNRSLTAGEYTEYINGNGKNEIFLNAHPVFSISSIKYLYNNSFVDLLNSPDTIEDSAIVISNSLILLKYYTFPKGRKNIEVVFDGGFTDAPDDLKGVCIEMSALKFFNSPLSGQSQLGLSNKNFNSTTSEGKSFKDMIPEWHKKLNRYRLINIYG